MTNDSGRQQHDERPAADVFPPPGDIAACVGGDLRVDGPAVHGIASARPASARATCSSPPPARAPVGARYAADALAAGAVAVLTDPAGAELVDEGAPLIVVADPRGVLGRLSAWFYDHPATALKTIGDGHAGEDLDDVPHRRGARRAQWADRVDGFEDRRRPGADEALTTPEAPALQALLAKMREEGVTWVSSGGVEPGDLDAASTGSCSTWPSSSTSVTTIPTSTDRRRTTAPPSASCSPLRCRASRS